MRFIPCACVVLALATSGCADREASHEVTDAWLGQWNGPEGTYLRIEGGDGHYTLTIRNLDGPLSYQGNSAGTQIRFERNGVMESIRATNGADTGMKWLVDKSDCLTIRPGEGFCRD